MRFCVRRLDVCLGKEKRILRKSAFWPQALTERRILAAASYGKAHSGPKPSRKGAFWLQPLTQKRTLRFPRSYKLRFFVTLPLGRRGTTARQAAGHYEKRLNWANALEQPPARLRGGLRQGPKPLVWNLIVFCYSG